MAEELQKDPFLFRSPLLLLPQTLSRLSIKAMESESTEEILKSLALKNASQLLEQAKAVLDSSSEFLQLEPAHKLLSKDVDVAVAEESAHKLLSKDVDVAVAEKVTDCRQRRRPAMGHKRAHFLFKPNHSQAFPQVGSSLDIDHLQDPDEFFKAFERLENAEKELKKSRGYSLEDPIQPSQSMLSKRRRPGIIGKTVNYKHLYPMHSGNVNTVPLQGNKVEAKLLSPSKPLLEMRSSICQHPEPTSQLGESFDRETTDGKLAAVTEDSVAGMENNANKLLNELLSNQRGLNMEQTVTLLQDCLRVKPVVLEDIHLPELDDVQRNYLEASQEPLPRPRKALADLQQVMNIMSNAKNQQENEIVTFRQRLPTLPRSPFAPMSVLQKHSLQYRLGDSPSGHVGSHVSHHEHSSLSKRKDKCAISPVVDTDQPDTISLSPFGDPTLERKSLCMDGLPQPPVAELSNTNTTGSNIGAQGEAAKDMTSQFNEPIGSKSGEVVGDMATRSDGLDSTFDDKVKDMFPETSVSEDLLWEDLTSGAVHSSEDPTETCLSMDRHLQNSSILQEQLNEVPLSHPASESEANIKVKREAPLRKQSKRNVSLLRKSLAGAGTKLESGLRRSTRIKSRPLQYWRGERFLYGRIHDSLPTVIGMKYASPAKGCEEPVLKVKSYVSDDYAELVEIASLH